MMDCGFLTQKQLMGTNKLRHRHVERYVKVQTTIINMHFIFPVSLRKIHGFYGFMFCGFLPISLRPVFREALKEKLKKENGLEGVEARFSFSRCTWCTLLGVLNIHYLLVDIHKNILPSLITGHQSPALFYQFGGDGDSWSQSSLHQSGVYTSR